MRTSYHDIKAEVLSRIRNNIWPPNANIPGEIDLAKEFGCARATVNRAMRELVDEGILERKRKAGTKVKSSPTRRAQFSIPIIREEITNTGAKYRYVLVERQVVKAPDWLRTRIDIPKDASVLHLKCMHYAGSNPYQNEDRWINLAAVPNASNFDFEDIGPNEWLVREVPYSGGEISFSSCSADKTVANAMETTPGSAMFLVERSTWIYQTPITTLKMYYPEGFRLITKL